MKVKNTKHPHWASVREKCPPVGTQHFSNSYTDFIFCRGLTQLFFKAEDVSNHCVLCFRRKRKKNFAMTIKVLSDPINVT